MKLLKRDNYLLIAELTHAKRTSGTPWIRNSGNLSMRKISVLTSAYAHPPVRTDSGGGEGGSQGDPTVKENAISLWRIIAQCFWVTSIFLGGKSLLKKRFL